jgi:predicted HicB family RNase H-like nuclease
MVIFPKGDCMKDKIKMVIIPTKLHQEVKVESYKRGISMRQYVRDVLMADLERSRNNERE